MGLGVTLAIAVVALALLYSSARRARTLCVLHVRGGELVVVRGGLPVGVIDDLRDVVRRSRLATGTLRVERDGARARLLTDRDIPPHAAQAMRNVVGIVPLAKLLAGARRVGR